jgi:hypothetical protein
VLGADVVAHLHRGLVEFGAEGAFEGEHDLENAPLHSEPLDVIEDYPPVLPIL